MEGLAARCECAFELISFLIPVTGLLEVLYLVH